MKVRSHFVRGVIGTGLCADLAGAPRFPEALRAERGDSVLIKFDDFFRERN